MNPNEKNEKKNCEEEALIKEINGNFDGNFHSCLILFPSKFLKLHSFKLI